MKVQISDKRFSLNTIQKSLQGTTGYLTLTERSYKATITTDVYVRISVNKVDLQLCLKYDNMCSKRSRTELNRYLQYVSLCLFVGSKLCPRLSSDKFFNSKYSRFFNAWSSTLYSLAMSSTSLAVLFSALPHCRIFPRSTATRE